MLKLVIALVVGSGCDAGPVPFRPAPIPVAPNPATPNGPQLVGADPNEPTLLAPSHAPVIGLAVGYHHSCAVHDDGAVSCWGSSRDGQIGVVDPDQSAVPIGVAVTDVVELSAEVDATCARQRSGRIVCWGQMENSSVDERPRPSEVGDAVQLSGMCARTRIGGVRCIDRGLAAVELSLHDVTAISAYGGIRGCAIVEGGSVKCWHRDDVLPVDNVHDAVELSVGGTFACARTASGAVTCWDFDVTSASGVGKPHALGITDAIAFGASPSSLCVMRRHGPIGCADPKTGASHELTELAGRAATALAVSYSHGCALSAGRIACWGDNSDGQVGSGTLTSSTRPQRVPGLDDIEEIVVVGESSCVRHRDGTLACFGDLPQSPSARHHQIPCPPRSRRLPSPLVCFELPHSTAVPMRVDAMPKSEGCAISGGVLSCSGGKITGTHDLVAVASSERHTCVLATDGTTACYGSFDGVPVAMPALDHARAIVVTDTERDQEPELCALREDQSVACVTPKNAAAVRALGAVSLVSSGHTACVVLVDGRAGCWGLNTYGMIGNGRTKMHDLGYVRGLTNVVELGLGRIHSCARLSDGGVACWGYGDRGQTGIGIRAEITVARDVAF